MNEKKIEEEPMFVLRASDPYAPLALRVYAQYRENGSDGLELACEARNASQRMIDWAQREAARARGEPVPDLAEEKKAEPAIAAATIPTSPMPPPPLDKKRRDRP